MSLKPDMESEKQIALKVSSMFVSVSEKTMKQDLVFHQTTVVRPWAWTLITRHCPAGS